MRKFSALCLMLMISAGAWAANELTVKPNIKAGETTGTIIIALDNATDYTAFQMDIKLPTGLSLANENDAMEIISEVNANHQVKYNTVDGIVKVVAFSFDGASSGNEAFKASGDMLVINVAVDASYKHDDVEISEIKFVTFSDLALVETFTYVNEHGEEVLLGDVNNDGTINVQDILQIVDKILGVVNPSFNEVAGDLNADGTINVQDILLVVDIILTNN